MSNYINIETYQNENQNQNTTTKIDYDSENHPVALKISNFLQMSDLLIIDFWKSDRNYASSDDIITFCKGVGLELSYFDIINLRKEIFSKTEIVYLQQFAEIIPFWNSLGKKLVSDFLKQKSDLMLKKIQSKQKKRPMTSLPSNYRKSNPEKSLTRQKTAMSRKQLSTTGFGISKNNSQKYLRKFKDREVQKQRELNDNIEKNKIDEEYEMLLKISELNNTNKQKEITETYRAYKNAEGMIKVRIFDINKFVKEITLKQFDTLFKNYKKVTKENKQWAISKSKENVLSQTLKNKNSQKSERQQELKNLLVNTVNLTNLLKEQIKIFKMKGIYGSDNI